MGLKGMINREIKITIGVVAIVSLIFIAMSYAIFKVDTTGSTDTIKFGDISLAFCKDSTCDSTISDIGNVIGTEKDANGNTVYSKIYPVSDPSTASDWNNLKPYIFTLTNDGDIPLYVSLYLEKDPTAGTIISDGVEYSEFVSDDEVKIAIGEGTSTPTISLYSSNVDADGNHKIASNILINVGEKKTFKLYAWLKSDATNASQGKYFVTQISARGEYFPSGSSSDVDSNLKTIELDLKDATADKNVKQVLKGEDVEFIVTPTNTSKTLSDLTISCTNDVTPTVSGSTLKFSNVQKGTICSVYESYKSAYNLLEYIGSTGTQYIDTGYVMSSNTEKIYADYEKTDVSDSVSIFGAEKNISGSDRSFTLIPFGTSTSTIYIGDDSSSLSLPSEANVRYRTTLEANGGNLKVSVLKVSDNTTTTNTTTYTVSNGNLTAVTNSIILFGNHTSSGYSQLSTVKIYSFKLWDNGVLKRNLVPVSRKSDNVLGMYDTVNNVFYTNSGTGTFTAGSVIE